MSDETTKAHPRRVREGFYGRFIKGSVLDIGAGSDPISGGEIVKSFESTDGDAQFLTGLDKESYDTVYSSHCLEHMRDPSEALHNWWRVLRPGGYLVVQIPCEDLFEQGAFPSAWNTDHKWTFSISKDESWSPRSKSVTELLQRLPHRKVIYIRTVDTGYDYSKLSETSTMYDQTQTGAEAGIEFVVQKQPLQSRLVSTLRTILQCPSCHRAEIIARGVTRDNQIDFQCNACGVVGEIKIDTLVS